MSTPAADHPRDPLQVLTDGLGPRTDRPARVPVVGAGMAGDSQAAMTELLKRGEEN